ncbi:uncharacterized protein BYT42DRAFT_36122 [Radiomyces spectabilis]|uniref:uncharacterized protein n=1 Tax=Radiomyces spectabilis TaxID=64574 RepID=UPI00221E91D3|nr:uncharacterized protein BYT42DRAFT_36122 [Radiomyces spectabilis]KAI8394243.1 hypothetical protein BYT42DRAFT_36122 [Radiomyces spectabilis]
MSSILVLQHRCSYGDIPAEYFTSSHLQQIRSHVLDELSWHQTFDISDSALIRKTLKDFRDDLIDGLESRITLLQLAKSKEEPSRNVTLAIESLIPALKDLDLPKISSESNIIAAYVHPIMQHLFGHNLSHVGHCANIPPESDETSKRPDHATDLYKEYQRACPFCFGKVKRQQSTETAKIKHFYRLALFAKAELDKHSLNGVICFQTIGMSTTFYYMTRKSNVLVFVELTTFVFPNKKQNAIELWTYLDELISLAALHLLLETNSTTNSTSLPSRTVSTISQPMPTNGGLEYSNTTHYRTNLESDDQFPAV